MLYGYPLWTVPFYKFDLRKTVGYRDGTTVPERDACLSPKVSFFDKEVIEVVSASIFK